MAHLLQRYDTALQLCVLCLRATVQRGGARSALPTGAVNTIMMCRGAACLPSLTGLVLWHKIYSVHFECQACGKLLQALPNVRWQKVIETAVCGSSAKHIELT